MKAAQKLFVWLVLLASIVLVSDSCFGSGFALYEASARGNAMAGAMVARADDPSALFFNPAGITQLPGLQMMAGATFVMPSTDVTTYAPNGVGTTTSTLGNVWVPPHFYVTYQANDKIWLGLAVFSPFGLGTEFPSNWPGQYNSYKAVIQTININPNLAYKVNDKLSFALGLDINYFTLDLKRNVLTPFGGVGASLQGDSIGVGCNAALHYRPFDWLKLGLSYRSQMTQDVSGDAKFSRPAGMPGVLFRDTTANGQITLPDEFYFGAAFYPDKNLSVELGLIWTRWSTYQDLTIQYETAPGGPRSSPTTTDVKNWHNVLRPFIGAEYKTLDWLDLRAGFAWDQEASDVQFVDYLVPANDRFLFSFGPGFHYQNWTLDLSYTYLLIVDRNDVPAHPTGVLPSSFSNGYAHMVGCSLGYKF
jgi:long-chain fatty acid transport protein